MSLFSRIDNSIPAAGDQYLGGQDLGYGPTSAAVSVTPDTAMRVATVFACVRVLAEGVASLPLHLYRRTQDGGKTRATDHPLYDLLHSAPSPELTSFDLREFLLASLCLSGNAYCRLYRDRAGRVREIVPIQPDRVAVDRSKRGDLVFSIDGEKRLSHRSIWRIAGLGGDGVVGYTPIGLAREAIGLAIATERHGARLFANGVTPSGVLETDTPMRDADALERLRTQLQEGFAGRAAHKPLVLERGLKWRSISLSAEEAQFLETRKYQRSEICAIYRVPPHLVGDLEHATYSNIEQQSLDFVVNSLRPWLVRIEQTITRDLIAPEERGQIFAEHSVAGLLRGDIAARSAYYTAAVRGGWMSRNEVRRLENLNPVRGLDDYLVSRDMGGQDQTTGGGDAKKSTDRTA